MARQPPAHRKNQPADHVVNPPKKRPVLAGRATETYSFEDQLIEKFCRLTGMVGTIVIPVAPQLPEAANDVTSRKYEPAARPEAVMTS